MRTRTLKVYDEDGNYIGDFEDLIDAMKNNFMDQLENELDDTKLNDLVSATTSNVSKKLDRYITYSTRSHFKEMVTKVEA
jgi:hypothetical protein